VPGGDRHIAPIDGPSAPSESQRDTHTGGGVESVIAVAATPPRQTEKPIVRQKKGPFLTFPQNHFPNSKKDNFCRVTPYLWQRFLLPQEGTPVTRKALASVEIEVNEFEQLVAFARHANRPLLNYLSGLSPELLFDCGGHTDESGYWCDGRTVQFTAALNIPINELGLLEALLKREPDSQQGNSIAA
jgi:hypothetical protein